MIQYSISPLRCTYVKGNTWGNTDRLSVASSIIRTSTIREKRGSLLVTNRTDQNLSWRNLAFSLHQPCKISINVSNKNDNGDANMVKEVLQQYAQGNDASENNGFALGIDGVAIPIQASLTPSNKDDSLLPVVNEKEQQETQPKPYHTLRATPIAEINTVTNNDISLVSRRRPVGPSNVGRSPPNTNMQNLYPAKVISSSQSIADFGTSIKSAMTTRKYLRYINSLLTYRNIIIGIASMAFVMCLINIHWAYRQIATHQLSNSFSVGNSNTIGSLSYGKTIPAYNVSLKVTEPTINKLHGTAISLRKETTSNQTLSASQKFGGVSSRSFKKWPSDRPVPCFDPNEVQGFHWTSKMVQRRPATEGLFYIKLVKTGSSTTSGVHLRLARNLAHRVQQQMQKNQQLLNITQPMNSATNNTANTTGYEICRSRFLHSWAGPKMLTLGDRDRKQSFLWTVVREPTKRYVSDFFHFQVSRKNVIPTAEAMKSYFDTYKHKHHYIDWLSPMGYRYKVSDPIRIANYIMRDYNFIGVMERLDESLVVLSILLDIPLGDILYLESKRSGGYDDGAHKKTCFFIQPSNLTSEMREYLSSEEWKTYVEPEALLFQAVNHSLDLTIEQLGRNLVEKRLATYKHAQSVVQKKCTKRTRFPCSPTGERRDDNDVDCWTRDLGCGFDCLDEVAIELGISE